MSEYKIQAFELLAECFFRQNGQWFHIGVITANVSLIALRALSGKYATPLSFN
jgi:hypothetical protein